MVDVCKAGDIARGCGALGLGAVHIGIELHQGCGQAVMAGQALLGGDALGLQRAAQAVAGGVAVAALLTGYPLGQLRRLDRTVCSLLTPARILQHLGERACCSGFVTVELLLRRCDPVGASRCHGGTALPRCHDRRFQFGKAVALPQPLACIGLGRAVRRETVPAPEASRRVHQPLAGQQGRRGHAFREQAGHGKPCRQACGRLDDA